MSAREKKSEIPHAISILLGDLPADEPLGEEAGPLVIEIGERMRAEFAARYGRQPLPRDTVAEEAVGNLFLRFAELTPAEVIAMFGDDMARACSYMRAAEYNAWLAEVRPRKGLDRNSTSLTDALDSQSTGTSGNWELRDASGDRPGGALFNGSDVVECGVRRLLTANSRRQLRAVVRAFLNIACGYTVADLTNICLLQSDLRDPDVRSEMARVLGDGILSWIDTQLEHGGVFDRRPSTGQIGSDLRTAYEILCQWYGVEPRDQVTRARAKSESLFV